MGEKNKNPKGQGCIERIESIASRRWFQALFFLLIIGIVILFLRIFGKPQNLERLLPYGYLGIFLISLIASLTVIFPIPAEAIIVSAAAVMNPFWVALFASVGGTIGEATAYFVGYGGRFIIKPEYSEKYRKAEMWMKKYGFWALFIFALAPFLIFDLVGIAAGIFRYPIWKFFLACWLGRIIRSLLLCYIGGSLLHLIIPFLT